MEGRIFPPLKPPWCRDLLQAGFPSDCPVPLCLPGPARGMNPRSVTGPGGTALLEKCHLLGCTRAPRAPGPPRLRLLHWQGQAVARSGPLTDSCSEVLALNSGSCLALRGWRAAEGAGAKVLLTCCSETCTHKCAKKLCCKSLVWKKNDSLHGRLCFLLIVDNINTWFIPKITAVGIFSL